jgi:hypothetical protein
MRIWMRGLFRRFRGALGTGLLWAAVFAPVRYAFIVVPALLGGFSLPPWRVALSLLTSGATYGLATGFVFSVGIGLLYRNRTLGDIRYRWMALLGAGAAVTWPALGFATLPEGAYMSLPQVVVRLVITGALGAAVSVASLKLARPDHDLIEEGDSQREALASGTVARRKSELSLVLPSSES